MSRTHRIVLTWLVLGGVGCTETRRTETDGVLPLVLRGRPNVIVTVGESASPAVVSAADHLVARLSELTGLVFDAPLRGTPPDGGVEMIVVAVGREALGEPTVTNTGLFDDAFRIRSERQGRRTVVRITSGTDIGTRYGVDTLIRLLGGRHPHPEARLSPEDPDAEMPLPLDLSSHPSVATRMIHLETGRPGPWLSLVYLVPSDDEDRMAMRARLLDWVVWHRFDTVVFDALSRATAGQLESMAAFVAAAQQRGLSVGAVFNANADGAFDRVVLDEMPTAYSGVDLHFVDGAAEIDAVDYATRQVADGAPGGVWTTALSGIARAVGRRVVYELPIPDATGRDVDVPVFFVTDVQQSLLAVSQAREAGAHGVLIRHRGPAYGGWLPAVAFATAAWDASTTLDDLMERFEGVLGGLDLAALQAAEDVLGDPQRLALRGDRRADRLDGAFGVPTLVGLGSMAERGSKLTGDEANALDAYADTLRGASAGLTIEEGATPLPQLQAGLVDALDLTALRAEQLSAVWNALLATDVTDALATASGVLTNARMALSASEDGWFYPDDFYVPAPDAPELTVDTDGLLTSVRRATFWTVRDDALESLLEPTAAFNPTPIAAFRSPSPSRVLVQVGSESVEVEDLGPLAPPVLVGVHEWTQGFLGEVDLSVAADINLDGTPDGPPVRNQDGVNDPASQSSALTYESLALDVRDVDGGELGAMVWRDAEVALVPRYEQGLVVDIVAMSLIGTLEISSLAELLSASSDGYYSLEVAERRIREYLATPTGDPVVRMDWVGFSSLL